jgi:pimeloyl-ACP methyl ester carboxylesterase
MDIAERRGFVDGAPAQETRVQSTMANIVLVPGAFHGGWWYNPIIPDLRKAGHSVYSVTPTGMGERRHLRGLAINLDTHIEDLVNIFEHEKIDDAILVGHSYAGMIITGAAGRLQGRIRSLVYLDAIVPENGKSQWQHLPPAWHDLFTSASPDGINAYPDPNMDKRTAPQPLATLLQPLQIAPGTFDVRHRHYVLADGFVGSPFPAIYDRLEKEGGWTMRRVPYGHDFMNEDAGYFRDFLLEVAATP